MDTINELQRWLALYDQQNIGGRGSNGYSFGMPIGNQNDPNANASRFNWALANYGRGQDIQNAASRAQPPEMPNFYGSQPYTPPQYVQPQLSQREQPNYRGQSQNGSAMQMTQGGLPQQKPNFLARLMGY